MHTGAAEWQIILDDKSVIVGADEQKWRRSATDCAFLEVRRSVLSRLAAIKMFERE